MCAAEVGRATGGVAAEATTAAHDDDDSLGCVLAGGFGGGFTGADGFGCFSGAGGG